MFRLTPLLSSGGTEYIHFWHIVKILQYYYGVWRLRSAMRVALFRWNAFGVTVYFNPIYITIGRYHDTTIWRYDDMTIGRLDDMTIWRNKWRYDDWTMYMTIGRYGDITIWRNKWRYNDWTIYMTIGRYDDMTISRYDEMTICMTIYMTIFWNDTCNGRCAPVHFCGSPRSSFSLPDRKSDCWRKMKALPDEK